MMKKNIILDKSFELAVKVVHFSSLLEGKRRFIIANQLVRSGTSVGANIWEAQSAESKADFIHKLKISSKEAEETKYWLLLCKKLYDYPGTDDLILQIDEVRKILSKIIIKCKIG